MGRVESNGVKAKPARDVKIGDMLHIKNEGGDFQVEVLGISDSRGPAAVAQALYKETEASKELRQKAAEERKALPFFERETVPSKRDRRRIIRFTGRS
jgi:ribosome-associated heat shock protein Hsp15